MPYEKQVSWMKALVEMFESIGYVGTPRLGLARCIAAFEANDKKRAIREFRRIVGKADNFACAITDLDEESLSPEIREKYTELLFGVMFGMSLLMGGNVK